MSQTMTQEIQDYWDENIHDLAVVQHEIGSREFFQDLEEYRFDKNRYLPKVVDFSAYRGKKLLEVGCGVGIDLVRFARGGAQVTGVDLSQRSIDLARQNFALHGLSADLRVMDGHALEYEADFFDVVYAHGLLPYTLDVPQMVREAHRVLKPGGELILQAYNKKSWFYVMSKLTGVKLEHEDAPAFNIHTSEDIQDLLQPFARASITYERFPVKTRLQKGIKGMVYNLVFVGAFNAIPRPLVRRYGWHIIARAVK